MRHLFTAGVFLLILLEIGVNCGDYSVPLTADVSLYNSPDTAGAFVLSHEARGRIVDGVLEYALLGSGTVAGRTSREYFLVSAEGELTMFDNRPQWLSACGQDDVPLAVPRRTADPAYWTAQAVLGAVFCGWLALGLVLSRRARPARQRRREWTETGD